VNKEISSADEAKVVKTGSGFNVVHDVTGKVLGTAKDRSAANKLRCDIMRRNGFPCKDPSAPGPDTGVDQPASDPPGKDEACADAKKKKRMHQQPEAGYSSMSGEGWSLR